MTWVRRARWLVGVLLACLSIPLLGGQAAWALDRTLQAETACTNAATPGTEGAVTFVAAKPNADPMLCALLSDAGWDSVTIYTHHATQARQLNVKAVDAAGTDLATLLSTTVAAGSGLGPVHAVAVPAGTASLRVWTTDPTVSGARLDRFVVQDLVPEGGGTSPSPSPSPVYVPSPSPSPYPVPGPTETWYAYPTPPAGGGTVGSCGGPDQDPCSILPAADATFALPEVQSLPLFLFLGLLLMVALTTFLLRQGRALRV